MIEAKKYIFTKEKVAENENHKKYDSTLARRFNLISNHDFAFLRCETIHLQ